MNSFDSFDGKRVSLRVSVLECGVARRFCSNDAEILRKTGFFDSLGAFISNHHGTAGCAAKRRATPHSMTLSRHPSQFSFHSKRRRTEKLNFAYCGSVNGKTQNFQRTEDRDQMGHLDVLYQYTLKPHYETIWNYSHIGCNCLWHNGVLAHKTD